MYHIKDDKRARASSQLIYKALSDLMTRKEFDDIKITEVVQEAQVGRATFYRNFDQLEDVLYYKCNERFSTLYDYLIEYYKHEQPIEYSFFITPFMKFWYTDSKIIEELMAAKRLKFIFDEFGRLLLKGFENITLTNPLFEDNIDYYIALRSGIAINVLLCWLRNNKKQTPEEISEIIFVQMSSTLSRDLFKTQA
jgi:AcrR family transcriptional regulator